jgi:hypothetical protein
MLSEFIIPHLAEPIARSRGHDIGPASAHVRTPDLHLFFWAQFFKYRVDFFHFYLEGN